MSQPTCEYFEEHSDDEFGYWSSAWGDPPVHTIECDQPPTVWIIDPYDNEPVFLCKEHGEKSGYPMHPLEVSA